MTYPDEARRFFDAVAGRYDRVYALTGSESRRRMERTLRELRPGSRVLDLGVGTGRELSALLDAGHSVTGMDVSPEMLARCARRSRPVPLVLGDLWARLPFGGATFDAVLALHGTLAHPPSPAGLVSLAREVARVLTADGVFVLEVPLPGWVDSAGDAVESHGRGRATFVDDATGRSIEALLFDELEWRAAIGPALRVASTRADDRELFLTAVKA